MDDLLSEKEQIDQMRAWWAEYGLYVISGVVIAVGLLVGFNLYNSSKLEAQTEASSLYEVLAGHVTDGDTEAAEKVAADLAADYANTSYAAQSRLAMARLYMDKNRDQDAADQLRELLAMRGVDELKLVAQLRLAQLLLYQEKAQDVIDLLEGHDRPAFAALYDELRGDAFAMLGRIDEASAAYRAALAEQGQSPTVDRALVQMKLNDLPTATTAALSPPEPAGDIPTGDMPIDDMPADEAPAVEPDVVTEDTAAPAEPETDAVE